MHLCSTDGAFSAVSTGRVRCWRQSGSPRCAPCRGPPRLNARGVRVADGTQRLHAWPDKRSHPGILARWKVRHQQAAKGCTGSRSGQALPKQASYFIYSEADATTGAVQATVWAHQLGRATAPCRCLAHRMQAAGRRCSVLVLYTSKSHRYCLRMCAACRGRTSGCRLAVVIERRHRKSIACRSRAAAGPHPR